MKFQTGDYEAVHLSPIWRDRADFIVAAYLGMKVGRREWEQLWAQKVASHRFRLCCIPFFTRNLALGDEIETDADFVFTRLIRTEDQTTFRVWFGGQTSATKEGMTREIQAMGALMEWSSDNLLALSVLRDDSQRLADHLHARERAGLLLYENGQD
jgi:hypothetical protein